MIDYISHYGDDLTVVNAARVSLGKVKTELDESDRKLINYLVTHEHTSPMRHCGLSVRVTAPIFVVRQWVKHRVGMEINEISGRYVEFDEQQHWIPGRWRKGSASIKQGSLSESIDNPPMANRYYQAAMEYAFDSYRALLEMGVCKEQARAVLPLATMTQFICTASLQAWWHFYRLRSDSHAQYEIQLYAREIDTLMSEHFPACWQSLKDHV
jgi:thymidylate synthase (FAD)